MHNIHNTRQLAPSANIIMIIIYDIPEYCGGMQLEYAGEGEKRYIRTYTAARICGVSWRHQPINPQKSPNTF